MRLTFTARRVRTFWAELRRRKVFTVGTAYLVAAWGASLGAAELLPAFDAPAWAVRSFVLAAVLGFPVALVLAWVFEFTSEGVVKDPGVAPPLVAGYDDAVTRLAVAGDGLLVSWRDNAGSHSRQFDRDFIIGRDPGCGLHVDDPMVSRRHVRVRLERGEWIVEDLGSRNGTLMNGALIDAGPLPSICEIQLYADGPLLTLHQKSGGATTMRAPRPSTPAPAEDA